MPSNADTIPSAGAFASFLIDAAPALDPRHVVGIDDFLAVPPVPAEPSVRDAESEARPVATSHPFSAEAADRQSAAPHFVSDETIRAADLPILPAISIEAGATPDLSASLGDDSLATPPGVARSFDADLGDSLITNLTAGVEEGRGGDVLPALAASLLADGLLADTSAMLPTVSPAGPTADGGRDGQIGRASCRARV